MRFMHKLEMVIVLFIVYGAVALADRPLDVTEEEFAVAADGTRWILVYDRNESTEPLQQETLQRIVQEQSCVLDLESAIQRQQQNICIIQTSQGLVSAVTQKEGMHQKVLIRPVRSNYLIDFVKNTFDRANNAAFVVVSFGLHGLHAVKSAAIGAAVALVSIVTKTTIYTVSGVTGAILDLFQMPFRVLDLITSRFLLRISGVSSVQTVRHGHLKQIHQGLHEQRQELVQLLEGN